MAKVAMVEAVAMAMAYELEHDPSVVVVTPENIVPSV